MMMIVLGYQVQRVTLLMTSLQIVIMISILDLTCSGLQATAASFASNKPNHAVKGYLNVGSMVFVSFTLCSVVLFAISDIFRVDIRV